MPAKKTGYYLVYKATCPNGKFYIGFTHYRLSDRKEQHERDAKNGINRKFSNAIKKYGKLIKWEIINTYQNLQFALNREKYFIKKLQARKLGYNLTDGGEGCPGAEFPSRRLKIIDNFGNLYIGYKHLQTITGITKSSAMSSIKHGYRCGSLYFSKYTDGMEKAIPRTSKSRCRKIIEINTGICFYSIKHASEFFNIPHQSIYRVCAGKRSKVNGYIFCYSNDYTIKVNNIHKKRILKNKFSKKIIDENGNIFENLTQASKSVKCDISTLILAIKNKSPCKNVSFCYYNQNITKCQKFQSKIKKSIYCHNNNMTYYSIAEAARDLGICKHYISKLYSLGNFQIKQFKLSSVQAIG